MSPAMITAPSTGGPPQAQGNLMVNTYTEERSQHVYCVIDKSRAMKMPFEGLSLLDYAINASLVLSSVALLKEDKAGHHHHIRPERRCNCRRETPDSTQ